jgi:hypothetical protein
VGAGEWVLRLVRQRRFTGGAGAEVGVGMLLAAEF